jgi:RNA polymerase sigma factor (TIGR02999 family)
MNERDQMLAELYGELRAVAAAMLRREAALQTLQPTELVHEAAMRIARLDRMTWQDRQHFFATSARILRQAMLDEVRKKRSAKRQAPPVTIQIDAAPPLDVEALDAALIKLERAAPELPPQVELRYFVGLGIPEIAAVSNASESTIKRRWQTARLWLASELRAA